MLNNLQESWTSSENGENPVFTGYSHCVHRCTTRPYLDYPREVVKRALACNAAAVVFAHNHPSGVAEASRADEVLTQALRQALALVDIKLLDHFIVAGQTEPLSFAERGLL